MLTDAAQFGVQLTAARELLLRAQGYAERGRAFGADISRLHRCVTRAKTAYGSPAEKHRRVVRLATTALEQLKTAIVALEVHTKAHDSHDDVQRAVRAIDRFNSGVNL